MTLADSRVSDNSTAGANAAGGGVHLLTGRLTLADSTVSGNSTTGDDADGGGIWIIGDLTLTNSTVSGNSTSGEDADGGGFRSGAGDVTLTNSTVSGNGTLGDAADGGGILAFGDLTLTNSTVAGNRVLRFGSFGGGIDARVSSVLTITNSIVAGNTDIGTTPNFRALGGLAVSFSLIGDNTGTTLTEAQTADGNGNLIGSSAAPIDPLLGPLAFNGGPTQTHALLPGSPAIDAGNSSLVVDQRGVIRGVDLPAAPNVAGGNLADIGSFERQVTEPVEVVPPLVTSFVRDEGGVLARPDLLDTFSVSFNVAVNVSADDLIIRNDTTGGTLVDTSGLTVDFDVLTNTATWDFSSLVLDPSFYSFELSDNVTSVADNVGLDGDADGSVGGSHEIGEVYVALQGDANLDGQVDVLGDGFALVGSLGITTGAVWADGDFNGDGAVDVLGDAFILVGRLGQSVLPPVPTLFAVAQSPSVSVSGSAPIIVAEPLASSFEPEDQDASAKAAEQIVPPSGPSQLVLSGDHELRDDYFGSDF